MRNLRERAVTGTPDDRMGRLAAIRTAVAVIGTAPSSSGGAHIDAARAADDVISLTTQLVTELEHADYHDPRVVAVTAACRVYRNAAFAFRKLAGLTGDADPQMAAVVASLIETGDHLVDEIGSET